MLQSPIGLQNIMINNHSTLSTVTINKHNSNKTPYFWLQNLCHLLIIVMEVWVHFQHFVLIW